MLSETIIKKEFVRKILERDMKYIRSVQQQVIEDYLTPHTGNLLADIWQNSAGKIIQSKGMSLVTVRFLKYLRFLDIKSNRCAPGRAYINIESAYDKRHKAMPLRRHLALYNRVVFGRLYNETQRDLRYGFTEEVKKQITEELESAGFEKK